jgi:hypothetical protein
VERVGVAELDDLGLPDGEVADDVVEEYGGHGWLAGRARGYKSEWRRSRWRKSPEGPRRRAAPGARTAAEVEEGSPAARVRVSPAMAKGGKAH